MASKISNLKFQKFQRLLQKLKNSSQSFINSLKKNRKKKIVLNKKKK